MARALIQFRRFAHFEPGAPSLAAAEYTALVQRITRRAPWRAPLPVAERVVCPGFGSPHELTREAEAAVKAGLPRRLWDPPALDELAHHDPPAPTRQQERVAAEIVAELRVGRPVQLLITNFPRIRLNHSVLAFDFRASDPDEADFSVHLSPE
jgi:hypothetical protein